MPPQPLVLLPSSLGTWILRIAEDECSGNSFSRSGVFIQKSLLPMHEYFVRNIDCQDDDMRCGCLGQVREVSKTMVYPGASINSPQTYRTILLALPYPFSWPADSDGDVSRVGVARCMYLILYDSQVALADLLEPNGWVFMYRPCVAHHSEEPALFGSSGSSEGVSMAYEVVHRPADHIDTSLEGMHHLLYGSVSVLAKIAGAELVSLEGESTAGWVDEDSLIVSRCDTASSGPYNIKRAEPGQSEIDLLGRVMDIRTTVTEKCCKVTVSVTLRFVPSSLHAGNTGDVDDGNCTQVEEESVCSVVCTASADVSLNAERPPFAQDLIIPTVKLGQQLYLDNLKVVSDLDVPEQTRLFLLGAQRDGKRGEDMCKLLLPATSLSALVQLRNGLSNPHLTAIWRKLITSNDSADEKRQLPDGGDDVINVSRVVSLSTSPGIMQPVGVSSLLSMEATLSTGGGGGLVVVCGYVTEFWPLNDASSDNGLRGPGRQKRRKLDVGSIVDEMATQMLVISDSPQADHNHKTIISAFTSPQTISTSSVLGVNKSMSIDLDREKGKRKFVFMLSVIPQQEEMDPPLAGEASSHRYRIEAIADENIGFNRCLGK